ncbi:hypothetical protein G4B88_018223 [Cannabis sativa]|uniref:NB-ARC domain, LRR domain containing protein n=1 Tax=Cannabis sativa TaxID=3483 RepID=A0A7J6FAJ7_CANSA|nr:hypothetical protein G4B88_018223 [Cannabis sativa]
MAETFLTPVIEKLLDLLITQPMILLKGVRKEVKSLKDELKIIQPFLIDAEKKLSKGELGDAAKEWLKQLKEVAERVEDVVDEYLYHFAKHDHHYGDRGFLTSIRRAGGYVRSLKLRHDLASQIQDINKSLQKVKERGQSYGLRSSDEGSSSSRRINTNASVIDPRLGSLFVNKNELVGMDSISTELVKSLIDGPSTRSVISLVGEGGIGKTTLARNVYNAEYVRQHFECFAWITVSQSYDLEKVLYTMKNQICPMKEEHIGSMEGVMDLLRKHLQTMRYVIVFDDVWDSEFWSCIKHALPSYNNKGDRVIITTRNTRIANDANDTPFDQVQFLKTWPPELAWELFCRKAFRFEFEASCPQELEQLSREIISKCHGLPLVIAAVAGLFSKKQKSKLEWERVLDNLNYEFEKNPKLTNVSKILSFSYDDLPYHLKSCFLYFGSFPQDSIIFENKLYRLWIAEDFIKSRRDKTEEQVAEEYLTELIHRNLVSFVVENGIKRRCRVHDLIHDVILTKYEELCFCQIINQSKLRFKGDCLRLAINNTTKGVLNLIGDYSKTRSIFFFDIDDELTESFIITLFRKCKFLKVLDFEDAPLDKLPKEVGNLFNLKYLNLRMTNVKLIPKSIGNLQNLQTLNVTKSFVQDLPIEINKLRNLRHLLGRTIISYEIDYRFDLDIGVKIHKGIGCLEELQTLSSVRVSSSRVDLVKELEKMRKLKILGMKHLTAGIAETLCVSLEKMSQLETLYLQTINEDEILDLKSLSSPPPFLRYLALMCQLQQLPHWISKLQHLQGLELWSSRLTNDSLKHLKHLPNLAFLKMVEAYIGDGLHFEEGGFKRLKELILHNMEDINVLKIETGALPLLEKLAFGPFPLMREMPSDIKLLTNLKSLEIRDMSREFVVDLQPNCPGYWKIDHVPSVIFWYKFKGNIYETYKLGKSNLLERLQAS